MRLLLAMVPVLMASAIAVAEEPVTIPAFAIRPKWQQWFPADKPFFAEKHPDGSLRSMNVRYLSRLEGASATLHENGELKALGYYPGGVRQGAYRVWNEDGGMLYFGQFKDGKPQGMAFLFADDQPYYMQQWDGGKLVNETLLARKGKSFVTAEDAAKLDKARDEMTSLAKQIDAEEAALRTRLREWTNKQTQVVEDAQSHAMRRAGAAKMDADTQRARHEGDAVTAAAHTRLNGARDRKGRAAAADARLAAQDRKATVRKGTAMAAEDKRAVANLTAAQEGESKDLHAFAVKSLEGAIASETPELRPSSNSTTRTYLVTYREGGKKGASHTDEIVATSRDDARSKVLAYRPHAKFKKVVEK